MDSDAVDLERGLRFYIAKKSPVAANPVDPTEHAKQQDVSHHYTKLTTNVPLAASCSYEHDFAQLPAALYLLMWNQDITG